jgi:hypothetical protein
MHYVRKVTIIILLVIFCAILIKVVDLFVGIKISFDSAKNTLNRRSINLKSYAPYVSNVFEVNEAFMARSQGFKKGSRFYLNTDENGYIIKRPLENKNKPLDIVFYGGSTVEAIAVDEDKRFAYLVSEKLSKSDGVKLRTLNGGMSGNNAMHSLLNFLGTGIDQRPKIAVLMHAVNDVVLLSKTLSYWDTPASYRIIKTQKDNLPEGLVSFGSINNLFIPNIFLKLKNAEIVDDWEPYRENKINSLRVVQKINSDFKASLKSFVRVSKAWGISPVLMTQFSRFTLQDSFVRSFYYEQKQFLSYEEFIKLYELANNVVREVALEEGVVLIDLDKSIEKSSKYIYDAVHLNTAGSELVADIIASKLHDAFPGNFILK